MLRETGATPLQKHLQEVRLKRRLQGSHWLRSDLGVRRSPTLPRGSSVQRILLVGANGKRAACADTHE